MAVVTRTVGDNGERKHTRRKKKEERGRSGRILCIYKITPTFRVKYPNYP